VALLQRAQRQHGLRPCEASPLPFALHPVLDHGTTRRLHDTGLNGQTHCQVLVVFHPAPVVVEERDDLLEGLPPRLTRLLRHGPQSLHGLAETLGLNLEQTQHVFQRLSRNVGIVPLFRYDTLRYGLAE
jgi:hypothetical protein